MASVRQHFDRITTRNDGAARGLWSARSTRPTPSLATMVATCLLWVLGGCLPDMASDAALQDRLRALAAAADGDSQAGDGSGGDTGDDASDGATPDGDDALNDSAGTDGAGSDATANDTVDTGDAGDSEDADAADGSGNIGASCSNTAGCVAPANVAPCLTPICADGNCALTSSPAGTACAVQGLTLDQCRETRCSGQGTCEVVTSSDGAACDADDFGCTGPDTCKAGVCVVGPKIECPQGDNACAPVGCVSTGATSSICQPSFKSDGTACDDGKVCTIGDACDGGGSCAGLPNPCTAVATPCALPTCDTAKDACVATPKAKGDSCADSSGCFKPGTCDENGACKGQVAVCDDGNPCTDDVCDTKGGCAYVPHTGPCNDGDVCTIADTCDGKGLCAKGKPRLYDTTYASALGAQPCAVVELSDGTVLVVGQRNGKPWRMRLDALGGVVKDATEAAPGGTWRRAIERKDGLLLAGVADEPGGTTVPVLRRFAADGTPQWTATLSAESDSDADVTALLPGADETIALLAIGRAGPSQSSIVRLLLWNENDKAVAPGKEFTFGGASESRELHGGAHEAGAKRWALAGRRQLSGMFKGWKGWIHRVNESMLFGGESDFLPTGAVAGDLQSVTVVANGYLAVGAATSSADGHDDGWIVRADDKLGLLWQKTLPTLTGVSVLVDVQLSSWGEILAVGKGETGPNAADTSSQVWRLSGFGANLGKWSWPASGGSLLGARALSDGWQLIGSTGLGSQRVPQLLRTTPWLQASCAAAGGCAALAASACDDNNPCTVSNCVIGKSCQNAPLTAGEPCGAALTCTAAAVCQ